MISVNNMIYQWKGTGRPDIDIERWDMSRNSCFVYGASGCGKSTFLNILSGILVAQKGEVVVLGEDIAKKTIRERDSFRAKNIGVIYQQFNLLPFLTGLDNILLSLSLSGSKNEGGVERIYRLMSDLKLPERILSEKPGELSVGQQQRLAIVRALVNNPKLILADEPTSALDSSSRDKFIEILLQQCSDNDCQVVFFSHDMSIRDRFCYSEKFEDINRVARGVEYAS